MSDEVSKADFWSMHSSQLHNECRDIARADPARVNSALRNEAHQLAAEWEEAIELPHNDLFQQSRRESQISALRKRTIEILVHVYGDE